MFATSRVLAPLTLVCLTAGLTALEAAPKVQVFQRERTVLHIRVPTATQVDAPKEGFVTLDVDPDTGGETTIRLLWPGSEESRLRLFGKDRTDESGARRVDLRAELELPDGSKVRSRRSIDARGHSAALFEVHRRDQRALILTIESEVIEEIVLPGVRAAPGQGVLFLLEVQRVLAGRVISLENNQLHSFVGESVTYSFRLGESTDADSVHVELKPLRVMTDLVEVEVEVTGSLPGDGGRQLVSRREEWLTSRGAASTVALESGDPPTGYRFVVTTMF